MISVKIRGPYVVTLLLLLLLFEIEGQQANTKA